MAPRVTADRDPEEITKTATLGHLRLRHVDTNEIVLIPTPSNDPNDPLNWRKPYKIYLTLVVCLAIFMCNFLAAGPTVDIVNITLDFTGIPPTDPRFTAAVSKIAYCFTTTALLQGTSNWFWMPFILKYGRRPLYLISFTGYFGVILWSGFSKTYPSELAARIFLGVFTGTAEAMAPLSIADLWYLHERGLYMAIYTACLSAGVSAGIILSGLITINLSWRYIYYIASALVGAMLLLVFFTFPETAYNRDPIAVAATSQLPSKLPAGASHDEDSEKVIETHLEYARGGKVLHQTALTTRDSGQTVPPKKTYLQSLAFFNGIFVKEPLWPMLYRPIFLLAVPSVFWATMCMSVTIGFLVAISSNFSPAFAETYGFAAWQSGLCFISGLIGTFMGIYFGGALSDTIADFFTKRNNGMREPEMRLPAVAIGMISSPLGLILYGVGINNQMHWIVPTLGLGFVSFSIAQATNVSLVYVIDSYRPIAGETVVTQLAFKSLFGFLLSFYTNPWIAKSGYSGAFGEMAAISGFVLALWVPFYIWGAKLRRASMKWGFVAQLVGWGEDREVGE